MTQMTRRAFVGAGLASSLSGAAILSGSSGGAFGQEQKPGKQPDPDRKPYLGMRPGDLDKKWYAKYWNPKMAPLPDHIKEAVLLGPQAWPLTF
jgi:hypothetical protein